ncbi:hypothetical protein [Bacteroides sp. 519]|uniref:hypothetical protein n=1 Tax=Bacteroides sp. 519 TaxID=2302937 RepID=UPI0013D268A6|nr:hypothetical protein [Bacteroides sp. 519]NDV57296.1 hypothetical protein [Bacteroides sp. 519]
MRKNSALLITTFSVLLFSCTDNRQKIDNSQLLEKLQTQVDSIINLGYKIDNINLYTTTFSDEGPGNVGYFKLMFINAVPSDPAIEYMANFSYSAESDRLTFHGYPTSPDNKRKEKIYSSSPNFSDAISKLEEMKQQIPDNYKFDNLLFIKYSVVNNNPIYLFEIELKPDSDDISHPKVKQEKKSYVKYSTRRRRKKYGATKKTHHTEIKKKIQHTITFKVINDQIELK